MTTLSKWEAQQLVDSFEIDRTLDSTEEVYHLQRNNPGLLRAMQTVNAIATAEGDYGLDEGNAS